MVINLKEDSQEPFVQELYEAGFTEEQVIAMVRAIVKFICLYKDMPFRERKDNE